MVLIKCFLSLVTNSSIPVFFMNRAPVTKSYEPAKTNNTAHILVGIFIWVVFVSRGASPFCADQHTTKLEDTHTQSPQKRTKGGKVI